MNEASTLHWLEAGVEHSALWHSENQAHAPKRAMLADDSLSADTAYKLVCEGSALLWRGDFQNARQMLQALTRRIDRPPHRSRKKPAPTATPAAVFHRHRQAQAHRAHLLSMLLIPLNADYSIPLRRAPEVGEACQEAYGPAADSSVLALRELLGVVGAHEWRKKGVLLATLGERVYPHYGVFSPVRGEYLDLVAQAELPATALAFDIGTGTGVIAALLVHRGIAHVVATDNDARALACAQDNVDRLGLKRQIKVQSADLFPVGRAGLIVCNPPWIPARPCAVVEQAIYDPDSRMLGGFLAGLAQHLEPGGEGWLILSDIAEHLQLRSREQLLGMIAAAGLQVLGRIDIKPRHAKSSDTSDPLHFARAQETTSLWRLAIQPSAPATRPD